MKTVAGLALAVLLALAAPPAARAADGKIAVVAAENFYGDIARQIGGDRVAVVSIMNNPDQDPHLFETTPGIVRQIADAQIVDLQRRRLRPVDGEAAGRGAAAGPHGHHRRRARRQEGRRQSASVVRARRPCRRSPRRWPPRFSKADRRACRRLRGAARGVPRLAQAASTTRSPPIRAKYAGAPVTATEPVFGYMAERARPDHAQRAIPARR